MEKKHNSLVSVSKSSHTRERQGLRILENSESPVLSGSVHITALRWSCIKNPIKNPIRIIVFRWLITSTLTLILLLGFQILS